jgi:hypothetical protein
MENGEAQLIHLYATMGFKLPPSETEAAKGPSQLPLLQVSTSFVDVFKGLFLLLFDE